MKPKKCPWHLEIITLNEPYTASKGKRAACGRVHYVVGIIAQCVYTHSHAYMAKIPVTYHEAPTTNFRLF